MNGRYSQTIVASNGTAPYTYTVTSGTLPQGLSLSTSGDVVGTPTRSGSFTFTVTATDSAGFQGSQSFTIQVAEITLAPTTLSAPVVNVPYSQTLSATGGTAPYRFSVTNGTLPSGLTLSTDGVLSGTPTAPGSSSFTVTAIDSAGVQGSQPFTLQVVPNAITLAPTTLPSGTVNVLYTQTLTASGGVAPYKFLATAGALPGGLTLSTNGVLSGTSSVQGSSTFTVTVTDNKGAQATQSFTLQIQSPGVAITISPSTLPNGVANTPYAQTLVASRGTAPYVFAVTSGTLPAGLTLSAAGILSGSPTSFGSSTFTVTVTDSARASASQSYTLSISQSSTGQIQPVSPPNQFAMPNAPLPGPLVGRVVSPSGVPIAGAAVTWAVIQGGGTLSGQILTSDANGLVQTNYTMGPGQQDNIVRATVTGSGSTYDFIIRNQQAAVVTPAKQIITPQAQIAVNTPLIQLNNIQVQLDNQRLLRNPTVTQGLNVSYNGKPLPSLSVLALAPTDKDGKPISQQGGGASADQDPAQRLGLFIQGNVDLGKQAGSNSQPGFDVRTNGLTIGLDYRFPGNHVLGAGIGLMRAKADLTENAGNQDAKGYSLSLFGEYVPAENAYIDVIVNFGRNKYDSMRRVTDAVNPIEYNSNPRGNQFGVALSAGYQFYAQSLTMTPYGRVEYVNASIDAFQESGSPNALQVDSQRYTSTVLSLGGQTQYAISMPWGVLVPFARAEYQYTAQSSAKQVNAQLVGLPTSNTLLTSVGVDKSNGNLALGASAVLPRGISGYFNYQHLFGKQNYEDNRYTLGIHIDF